MTKKIIIGLLITLFAAAIAGAAETENGIPVLDQSLVNRSYFSNELSLYASGSGPWGGHPITAGLINTLFGIWSFTNGDILGGIVTAGLYIAGIVCMVIIPVAAFNSAVNSNSAEDAFGLLTEGTIWMIIGGVLVGIAPVYGFIRGFSQYQKMTGATAGSFSDNPLKNTSFVIFPTGNGVAANITYKASY